MEKGKKYMNKIGISLFINPEELGNNPEELGNNPEKPEDNPEKPEDILNGADDRRTDPKFNHNIGFIPFAYHLVPPRGIAKVAAVMRKGERKDRDGWEKVPVEEHLNHALSHILCYLTNKHADHHLANAGCRILMALDLDRNEVLPNVPLGERTRTEDGRA